MVLLVSFFHTSVFLGNSGYLYFCMAIPSLGLKISLCLAFLVFGIEFSFKPTGPMA